MNDRLSMNGTEFCGQVVSTHAFYLENSRLKSQPGD